MDRPNPDFSALASKPPQNPQEAPSTISPLSSSESAPTPQSLPSPTRSSRTPNYTQTSSARHMPEEGARATPAGSSNRSSQDSVPGPSTSSTTPAPTVTSAAGWRPKTQRIQSWSEQDMKRKFQERLLGVRDGEGGFTSGGEGESEGIE